MHLFLSLRYCRQVLFLSSLLLCSCVNDRYVGSIGRNGTYSNRGYGLLLRLGESGLEERWRVVDPHNRDEFPLRLRPETLDEPIDLDGDGRLQVGETVHRHKPMLRLVSKTATVGAQISIDVQIVRSNNASVPLLDIAKSNLKKTLVDASDVSKEASVQVQPGFSGVTLELQAKPSNHERLQQYLVSFIDQDPYESEENIRRRQIVKIELKAPYITDSLRNDMTTLLRHLVLNYRSGSATAQERW